MPVDTPSSRYPFSALPELRQSAVRRFALPVAFIAALVVIVGVFTSSSTVQAGHVGVITTFGSVEPRVLQPGFHMVVPFVQRIVQIDTRVLPHTFRQIDAASAELQGVKLTGTMNYHLDPNRAYELYQNVGLEFANNIIDPAFSDFIKEVVPQYYFTDTVANHIYILSSPRALPTSSLSWPA